MSNAGFQDLLSRVSGDASVFAHQLNLISDQVLLIELDAGAQDQASFLDERVLDPQTRGAWFSREQVEAALADKGGAPHGVIFHMGHCGSTLISKLVARATGTAGLREPLPLRTLAADKAEGAAGFLSDRDRRERVSLLGRCWLRGDQPVVLKATSMCTGLADDFDASVQKVFIYQQPETHLAILLAGANAAVDLKGFAQMRHKRLARDHDLPPLAGMDTAELAALAWASEACDAAAKEIQAFSFDALLENPADQLGQIITGLGLDADATRIERGAGQRYYADLFKSAGA